MTDQTKLRKRLEALLKLPENQICADCGKRGPRWASANLGVFMCIECSGIHRNLGVHISFVRSVNLDSWSVLQVQFMEEWGNGRANKYYEANVPREYLRPKENDSVRNIERFIRDKYEHKRFIASSPPPKSNNTEEQPVEQQKVRPTTKSSAHSAPSVSKPKQVVPAPAAPEPNLLDFMDTPPPAPVPTPVTNQSFPPPQQQQQQQPFQQPPSQSFAPPVQQTQGFSQGGFGDFGPPVSFSTSNSFGAVTPTGYSGSPQINAAAIDPFLVPHPQSHPLPPAAAVPVDQQQPQLPVAPKQSADAILSLYSVPANNYGGPQGAGHGMGIHMMGGGGGGYPGGPMQMMQMHNQGQGQGQGPPRPPMGMGGHSGGMMMMQSPGGYPQVATGYPQQQQQPPLNIPGYGYPQQQQQQQQQSGFLPQQQQQNIGMGMGGQVTGNYMNQQQPYGQISNNSMMQQPQTNSFPPQQQHQYQQQQQQQQQQHPNGGMGMPFNNLQSQNNAYGMMPPHTLQQPSGGGGFPNYGGGGAR